MRWMYNSTSQTDGVFEHERGASLVYDDGISAGSVAHTTACQLAGGVAV